MIHRLRPLLALEPAPRPVADVERLWIVDGTLVPVRDRTVAASSRNNRFSANVQVIIDADSRLVIASARPVPGNKADAHAWRESDLPAIAAGTTVRADGAYLGTGLIVPHRGRSGRPLLRGQAWTGRQPIPLPACRAIADGDPDAAGPAWREASRVPWVRRGGAASGPPIPPSTRPAMAAKYVCMNGCETCASRWAPEDQRS